MTQHIMKRGMKNFNNKIWIDSLRNQDFSNISSSLSVDSKTKEFPNKINSALDECAPYKKFKTRKNLKPGITEQAKKLILERDKSRQDLTKASKEDKPALQAKYKQLRNRVVNIKVNVTSFQFLINITLKPYCIISTW